MRSSRFLRELERRAFLALRRRPCAYHDSSLYEDVPFRPARIHVRCDECNGNATLCGKSGTRSVSSHRAQLQFQVSEPARTSLEDPGDGASRNHFSSGDAGGGSLHFERHAPHALAPRASRGERERESNLLIPVRLRFRGRPRRMPRALPSRHRRPPRGSRRAR